MAALTSTDLGAYLGRTLSVEQAESVIQVVTSQARAYTRNRGFVGGVPNDEVRSVILSAAARLISNPSGAASETVGPESVSYRTFGWSLNERLTLDRYRVKAR